MGYYISMCSMVFVVPENPGSSFLTVTLRCLENAVH